MGWNIVAVAAIFVNVAASLCVRPYPPTARCISPSIQPTMVDGTVQSLIDTIQLFIVSDLLEETLPEKQRLYSPTMCDVGTPLTTVDYSIYDVYDCDEAYPDLIFDPDCPDFVTDLAPICKTCTPCKPCVPGRCVNFGLNEQLVLPPLAPELPCGLGYLPGALPMVAKAFAPCSKCCGCSSCSAAALPVCSPYSCVALATPLCPDLSCFVKPIIL